MDAHSCSPIEGFGRVTAYYNEHQPHKAAWLRQLISDGHIAPGEVDERNIEEVKADEIRGFTQCHFFAGIGGWSLALRMASWPDDKPVWTGSCPCQSFSPSGNKKGRLDARHLWPVWFDLIAAISPARVFGEQVSAAIAHGWLDEVADAMEGRGYAFGQAVLPACSVGAPFEGERLYFAAEAISQRLPRQGALGESMYPAESNFREADRFVDAFQGNSLPYVCPVHDGVRRDLAEIALFGAGDAIVPKMAAAFIKAAM